MCFRFSAIFGLKSRSSASAGFGEGSGVCDNCIDNICFFGNDMYIMSDIAHMLKINQV